MTDYETTDPVQVPDLPRLCWRMDPDESFSDWTIHVVRSGRANRANTSRALRENLRGEEQPKPIADSTVDVYHVHRNILGLGPRGSHYFAGLFRIPMRESVDRTSRLELNNTQADLFPYFLDSIYHGTELKEVQKQRHESNSSIQETKTNGHGINLFDLKLEETWQLGRLFDYFDVPKLKIVIFEVFSVYRTDEALSLLKQLESIQDNEFREFIFQKLCWNVRMSTKVPHSKKISSESLSVLAPYCMKVAQRPHRHDLDSQIKQGLYGESIYEDAMHVLEGLNNSALIEIGFADQWLKNVNFDCEEKNPWSSSGRLSRLLGSRLHSSSSIWGCLLAPGVWKKCADIIVDAPLTTLNDERGEVLLRVMTSILDATAYEPRTESMIALVPFLSTIVLRSYSEEIGSKFYDMILKLINKVAELPAEYRLNIINKFELPISLEALIHPHIHDTFGTHVVIHCAQVRSDPISRSLLVKQDIDAEVSLIAKFLCSKDATSSALGLGVVGYLLEDPDAIIDRPLAFLSSAAASISTTSKNFTNHLIQLTSKVANFGTRQQLASFLCIHFKLDSESLPIMAFLCAHFVLLSEAGKSLGFPSYFLQGLDAVEDLLALMNRNLSFDLSTKRTALCSMAEQFFGSRLFVANELMKIVDETSELAKRLDTFRGSYLTFSNCASQPEFKCYEKELLQKKDYCGGPWGGGYYEMGDY